MSGFLSGRTSLTTVQTADIAADAITLAKMAAGTDGNIISYDASGNPVAIATGSDGQALHSAGAGAQPAFETLSGAGWEFVEKVTASTSSTIELGEGDIDSGYDYIILCRNVDNSADFDTTAGPKIQFGTGGTPTYQTSGYKNQSLRAEAAGTTSTRDDITAGISIASPNTVGGAGAGEIWSSESVIPNAATSVIHQCISTFVGFSSVAEPITAWNGGYRTTADAITGLKVFPASGTFISGDFILCKRKIA